MITETMVTTGNKGGIKDKAVDMRGNKGSLPPSVRLVIGYLPVVYPSYVTSIVVTTTTSIRTNIKVEAGQECRMVLLHKHMATEGHMTKAIKVVNIKVVALGNNNNLVKAPIILEVQHLAHLMSNPHNILQ